MVAKEQRNKGTNWSIWLGGGEGYDEKSSSFYAMLCYAMFCYSMHKIPYHKMASISKCSPFYVIGNSRLSRLSRCRCLRGVRGMEWRENLIIFSTHYIYAFYLQMHGWGGRKWRENGEIIFLIIFPTHKHIQMPQRGGGVARPASVLQTTKQKKQSKH